MKRFLVALVLALGLWFHAASARAEDRLVRISFERVEVMDEFATAVDMCMGLYPPSASGGCFSHGGTEIVSGCVDSPNGLIAYEEITFPVVFPSRPHAYQVDFQCYSFSEPACKGEGTMAKDFQLSITVDEPNRAALSIAGLIGLVGIAIGKALRAKG